MFEVLNEQVLNRSVYKGKLRADRHFEGDHARSRGGRQRLRRGLRALTRFSSAGGHVLCSHWVSSQMKLCISKCKICIMFKLLSNSQSHWNKFSF